MKVCLINNFPPYSGTGRIPYALFKYLNKIETIQADLVCTHVMQKEEFSWLENEKVHFLQKFAYKDHENLSRFLIYFVDPHKIPKGYDLYHVTNHMLARYTKFRKPSVVTLHDVLQFKYKDKLGGSLISKIYSNLMLKSIASVKEANAVICVSEWSRLEAIKLLGLDPNKTFAIQNGLDHDLFHPHDKEKSREDLKLPKDKKIILNVGSEIERKNLDGVLKAFLEISKNRKDVLLVRLGEKTEKYDAMIKELGLTDIVVYLEKLKDEEVAKLYSASDLLIMPSFEEGFGLPIIEAMACGCPVVTSNVGAMKEVTNDAGFLVDPNDLESIQKGMEAVLNLDSNDTYKLVQAGLKRAGEFSWKKCAEDTIKVYEKVLGNKL